jgi:hypothetical protein
MTKTDPLKQWEERARITGRGKEPLYPHVPKSRTQETDYELKLGSGKVVTWAGSSGENAALRYADAHRGETVVAWRDIRYGVFEGVKPIIEPGEKSKYPRMLPTTRTSEEFIPARDRPYKGPPGRLEQPKYRHTPPYRGEFIITMDKMGNIIINHGSRPDADVFLQFESDKDVVTDLMSSSEREDLGHGWIIYIKDTEPRASILNELWDTAATTKRR